MTSARAYLPAAILITGCMLIWNVRSQESVALRGTLSELIPAAHGTLQVHDQEISAEERRIAGMTDYVMRSYSRDTIFAYSVYVGYYDYQAQGKTVHSPRNCLPGSGWEILQPGTRHVAAGGSTYAVNRYLMSNGAATAVVYYWYQGRGRVESNEYVVKWNLLRDAALYGRTDEALVRIVVPVAVAAEQQASEAIAVADSTAVAASIRLLTQVADALVGAPSFARRDPNLVLARR